MKTTTNQQLKYLELMKTLPDTYSCDELDNELESYIFEDFETAEKYAQETGGVIFTQVDNDTNNDVSYCKGIRFVNRTEIYAVVTHTNKQTKELK
ncbi:MAG: hypothetical protein Q8O88_00770 [bacterium]|nr:hypothetical protein [bacterium]